jgi:hypothetical protein
MLKSGRFFLALSFVFTLSVFLCVFFAFLKFFHPLLISLSLLIVCLFLAKKTKLFSFEKTLDRWELLAFLFATFWSLIVFLNFNISYLGGRDPGAMVEAAVMLSQNQKITFRPAALEFLNSQNSNHMALNFPGFIITEDNQLKTQFNLGYISYLAFWFSFLGDWGLKFANIPGIFIGLLAIFYLTKAQTKSSVWGLASLPLIAFTFPFFWHARQNLAETTAFGLLFTFIYSLFLYQKTKGKNFSFLFSAFFSLLVFCLVRIEGVFLMAILLIYLFFQDKKVGFPLFRSKKFQALLVGSFLIFLAYSLSILPFYKKMIKDVLGYSPINPSFLGFSPFGYLLPKTLYVLKVFLNYQLFPLLILGIVYILIIIFGGIFRRKLSQIELLLLLFLGPFLIYFLKPNISLDHPWILRRYLFAVLPFLALGTIFLIHKSAKKLGSLSLFVATIILIPSLVLLFRYISLKENPLIKQELALLATKFQKDDLILIDKSVSPNDWSLISEPLRFLFGLNTVYIYNPQDLAKIPKDKFPKAYLLASPEAALDYGPYLKGKKDDFSLTFSQLKTAPFNKKTDFKKPIVLPVLIEEKKESAIYEIK